MTGTVRLLGIAVAIISLIALMGSIIVIFEGYPSWISVALVSTFNLYLTRKAWRGEN